MTISGRIASLFPAIHGFMTATAMYHLLVQPSIPRVALVFFLIYGVPVLLCRVHQIFFPLIEGVSDISKKAYNPWWTTHQLQLIYIAIPALEGVLHLCPGLFTLWLRLWGSQVGRGVYWTPQVQIVDRGLLVVGDGVVVGHRTVFCNHAISPVRDKLSLIIKKTHLGSGSFIGAESQFGPGAMVGEGELVKTHTRRYWRGDWK